MAVRGAPEACFARGLLGWNGLRVAGEWASCEDFFVCCLEAVLSVYDVVTIVSSFVSCSSLLCSCVCHRKTC